MVLKNVLPIHSGNISKASKKRSRLDMILSSAIALTSKKPKLLCEQGHPDLLSLTSINTHLFVLAN